MKFCLQTIERNYTWIKLIRAFIMINISTLVYVEQLPHNTVPLLELLTSAQNINPPKKIVVWKIIQVQYICD